MKNWIKEKIPGILICLVISVPAWFLGKYLPMIGSPVFAILIGMVASMIYKKNQRTKDGVKFVSKKILQYAVILLGFGMNLTVIASVGLTSLPIIVATISTSLLVAWVLMHVLHIPEKNAILIGVGSSICGGSAIAATAPVIEANEEEIAQSISVIFLFNVIAAILFPTLGGLLGMTDYGFGLFAGTAVNDTSSVTAAASAWDTLHGGNALETAAIVKMTRTLAIIPITLVLAFRRTKKEVHSNAKVNIKQIFPYFILYFLLASVFTTGLSLFGVSTDFFAPLKTLSKFFITMAMSAIGYNTNLISLIKKGGKPIILGFTCWVSISLISILMQHILGIW